MNLNQNDNSRSSLTNVNDENSQASNGTHCSSSAMASSDFNIKNYFLMHKVLNKVLTSKYAWPFKNAVSEDDAPDYNTIITVSMFHFVALNILNT